MKPYKIISDGACVKNPGPGGWGMILITPQGHVKEFGGAEDPSTNNRMELMGFLKGLQEVFKLAKTHQESRTLRVVSDSKYVLEGAEKSLKNWTKCGWTTVAGGEVKNQDIWKRISKGLDEFDKLGFRVEYELVKGHAGNEGNERADQIAVRFSRGEHIDLYDGAIERYPISTEPGAAFEAVYLSYVGGVLSRHKTWPECQKAVEGKTGAKYKKIKNSLEERDTLQAWGIKK
ncbi:MAG: viroplasmin family protein [Bdellovibrionales bacterium]|nr:viroplasmin family protein [Bdellovibrionales bacterium]